MSDNNGNSFKWGSDVYTDKGVLESAIAEHLAALNDGLNVVKCGDKELQVRIEVTVLTGRGRPAGSKNAAKDPSAPKLTGTHFVAKRVDESFSYLHVDDVKANLADCVELYEFRTKDGATYAIEHGTVVERTAVWVKPAPEAAPAAE